ncbi:MAG: MmcQ/YjbR family DNA-binding protein [Sphingobacteriaceae bacterium]|jgi:hypothetical protein|nr:MmcQ/YjbR family DNA-binding protein [Sphingobacteriaceae bacterium]
MVTPDEAASFALALPEVTDQPHFDKRSFRVGQKIFATLQPENGRFVLKLSSVGQSVFCDFPDGAFCAVPGAWGKQGWTLVNLEKVREDMFKDALRLAWKGVAPTRLVAQL